ncbi:MAG: sialate O-acetylesterase, partial [Verrucomicrobiota bacterium]
ALSLPQPDVRIWYANPLNFNNPLTPNYNTGWQVLEPGFSVPGNFSPSPVPSPCFGPELSFVTTIAAANTNQRIALIKVTQGGTDLNTEWKPGGYMYICLTNTARAALQGLASEGASYTLRGMIWHQGENDTSGSAATNYETNLTQFINAVRRDLGVTNLPFVVGELATNKTIIVRQAQFNVAQNLPYVGFASADALQTIDNTHFDSAGVVTLGQRFANALEVPPTKFISATQNGGDIVLTASGLARASCLLLTTTNLSVGNWVPVSTNFFDGDGKLTLTFPIMPVPTQQFFALHPE